MTISPDVQSPQSVPRSTPVVEILEVVDYADHLGLDA